VVPDDKLLKLIAWVITKVASVVVLPYKVVGPYSTSESAFSLVVQFIRAVLSPTLSAKILEMLGGVEMVTPVLPVQVVGLLPPPESDTSTVQEAADCSDALVDTVTVKLTDSLPPIESPVKVMVLSVLAVDHPDALPEKIVKKADGVVNFTH